MKEKIIELFVNGKIPFHRIPMKFRSDAVKAMNEKLAREKSQETQESE